MGQPSPATTQETLADVRIFLTPEGAAYLAQRRTQSRKTCVQDGCPETRRADSVYCDYHDLSDAF